MITKVHLDFETQSAAKDVDAWLYAEHPTTKILCTAFAVNDDQPQVFDGHFVDYASTLEACAEDPDVLFVAHNAMFEMAIWENFYVKQFGYPEVPLDRWRCTMAKAYTHGFPGSLAGVSKALNLDERKDSEGALIMKELSRPRSCVNGVAQFWKYEDRPDDFEKLYSYCKQDVVVEREVDQALRDLSPREQRIWQIDQRMNRVGLFFDRELIGKVINLINVQRSLDLATFSKATAPTDPGLTSPTQRVRLKKWLHSQGYLVKSTEAPVLGKLLQRQDLPEYIRTAVEVASQNKTSLSKYPTALARTTPLGLYRGAFVYYGAHTGRWSGRGVQVQNLKRPDYDIATIIKAVERWHMAYACFALIYNDVSNALASAIRGMIIALAGFRMFVADFAQMEARVLAWLAGQQDVLDLFAAGEDLYCNAASQIYGYLVTKDMKAERFVGKIAVLALGYQGGIGALTSMAEQYGVDLMQVYASLFWRSTPGERDKAEFCYRMYLKGAGKSDPVSREIAFVADIIKQRWRTGNDRIEAYWGATEQAAITAIRAGKVITCGKVAWFTSELSGVSFLHCKLPGGRVLHYPRPLLHEGSRGKVTISYESTDKGRVTTYGGKLVENVTQAVQRDLTAEALERLEDKYPACAHIHDEIISYVKDGFGDLQEFLDIMRQTPAWATGIPIDVNGWSGVRYGKE